MVARGKHLYRPEYFEAQKVTSEGRILLNASFNQNIYLCLSMLVLIAIVTFITLAEYTRRETLVGLVSPLEGMVKVQANDSGYIEQIFVKEGDKVENLTPLYEIKTERFDDSGIAVKQRILVSIENQYQLLVERRQQESVKANLERQALVEDITRLDIESGILKNLLKLSNHELKLTHLLANKQKTLLKNHFLSDYDYQKIQLDLLSKQSKTESHNLNLQKLLREKQNRITSLKNKDISLDITLKDLDRQLEAMMQKKWNFCLRGIAKCDLQLKELLRQFLQIRGIQLPMASHC
ncbi:hypothetical protein [Photobacterium kishitanii]|uniref:hypothetical protein n=1 Tax=Photobacterium kishitanii TaxID=318456 RepID=UPI00273876EC|nr:hypothetical protein [Photobacterium kishitanii]